MGWHNCLLNARIVWFGISRDRTSVDGFETWADDGERDLVAVRKRWVLCKSVDCSVILC